MVTELLVSDLQASLDFWRGLLGFRIAYSRDGFVYLERPEGAQIMLSERDGTFETGAMEVPFGRGAMFQFYLRGVDTIAAAFAARGTSLFMPTARSLAPHRRSGERPARILRPGPGRLSRDGRRDDRRTPARRLEVTMPHDLPELPPLLVDGAVRAALAEDLGRAGDITSAATIPADARRQGGDRRAQAGRARRTRPGRAGVPAARSGHALRRQAR